MSGQPIRYDKTCLNCRAVVEKKYCPQCGQKNTESRQSFVHLFTHFFEDFTHYDNAFWKTIRHLLFKPALLTQEYLAGRRQKYVPPVRLYIFISFVTFFLISIAMSKVMTDIERQNANTETDWRDVALREGNLKGQDSINVVRSKGRDNSNVFGFQSTDELQKWQKSAPESERFSKYQYSIVYRTTNIGARLEKEPTFFKELISVFVASLPKVLFIYMPVFAFVLWLFHSKKKWYYFDHGIFTLHYFSFILLTICILRLIDVFFGKYEIGGILSGTFGFICFFWWIFYFFRSHSRMYQEKKWISRLKSIAMFFINSFLILIFVMLAMLYTAYSV